MLYHNYNLSCSVQTTFKVTFIITTNMWVPRCIVAAISMLVLTATPAVLIVEGTCHCADVCAQIIVTDFMMISHLVNVG